MMTGAISDHNAFMYQSGRNLIHRYGGKMRKVLLRIISSCEFELLPMKEEIDGP